MALEEAVRIAREVEAFLTRCASRARAKQVRLALETLIALAGDTRPPKAG
jgi:hypothetical protein